MRDIIRSKMSEVSDPKTRRREVSHLSTSLGNRGRNSKFV